MRKEEMIELAKDLLQVEDLSTRKEDLFFLKRQYQRLSKIEEDSYYEKNLVEQFNSLLEELSKREITLYQGSIDEKKAILEEVKAAIKSENPKNLQNKMNEFFERFKNTGRADKEQDDALWAEFKTLQKEAREKVNSHYKAIREEFSTRKARKQELIEEAKKALEIVNVKEAGKKIDELMEEWKKVGFAGKENDDALWKEFSDIRKEYYAKRRQHYEEMGKVFEERALKKQELIEEVKKLIVEGYYTIEEDKQIKELKEKWRAIGFAGKEKDDALYQEFNESVKKYYDDKKFYTFNS